jgi:uncharacterized membrane protein YfhO
MMAEGWKAFDNDKEVKIHEVNGLFKGIVLMPGFHQIRFVYHPDYFYKGLYFSLILLSSMLFIFMFRAFRRMRGRAAL